MSDNVKGYSELVIDKFYDLAYSLFYKKTDEREKYPFGRSTESCRWWEGDVRKIGEWSRKGELKEAGFVRECLEPAIE